MIGKTGAMQYAEESLAQVKYLLDKAETNDNAPADWRRVALGHAQRAIELTRKDDAEIEVQEQDSYSNRLSFSLIRRGYGMDGANISYKKSEYKTEVTFTTIIDFVTNWLALEIDNDTSYATLFFNNKKQGYRVFTNPYYI